MSEWSLQKLGDFVIHKKGFAFKSSTYCDNGTLIIRVSDTTDDSIDITTCKYIANDLAQQYADYSLEEKDIIIMTVGSWPDNPKSVVGKVVRVPNLASGALLNQNAVRLRSQKYMDKNFLYYLLKNQAFADYIVFNAQGSANQASITLDDIFLFTFQMPPLPEQKAIASVLSSLDDKIDLLHRQNKTLEAMAETLFRQWFVVEAEEDWPVVKLGDYVKTNIASISKDFTIKEIRYLDTGSLNEGKIDSFQKFNLNDAPSRAKRIVKHNDVLISMVRPNQKHYGIIKNPEEDIIVSTGFCVITCKRINPHFVYVFLTSNEMTEYLHSIAEGSTSAYPSLRPSDIEYLDFLFPHKEKMNAFSEYADDVWNKIEYNHRQIKILEKLRNSLLPKLMSGEARLKMN